MFYTEITVCVWRWADQSEWSAHLFLHLETRLLSGCIMLEEGFYKYLRSISVERCESVPELSGSHVPVLRAPLKCRLRVYQLSPVRSRAPGRGRLDRYRRSSKLLLMSVLFCNGGLMSLSSDVWGKNAHLRKESIFRTKHQSDTLCLFLDNDSVFVQMRLCKKVVWGAHNVSIFTWD